MARTEKTLIVVDCAKLGQELPALDRAPFPGEMGQRIFNEISQIAWEMWSEHAQLLINHYGLNMADPRSNEFLFEQMEDFLFGSGQGMPEAAGAPAKGRK